MLRCRPRSRAWGPGADRCGLLVECAATWSLLSDSVCSLPISRTSTSVRITLKQRIHLDERPHRDFLTHAVSSPPAERPGVPREAHPALFGIEERLQFR